MTEFIDYRVMYEYLDEDSEPHFEFTTVLSTGPEHAALDLSSAGHWASTPGFRIVQVVPSNGASTGYTELEREAAALAWEEADAQRSTPPLGTETIDILRDATDGR